MPELELQQYPLHEYPQENATPCWLISLVDWDLWRDGQRNEEDYKHI